jgi:hypothetical protein
MIVWPVSSSVLDEERRIFFGEALESIAHLFLITLGLWLDAIEITGSGKVGGSRRISRSSSQKVSPVRTSFTPTRAAMSPE